MSPFSVAIAALTLASAADLPLKPTDWPQFRGPNRDGVSAETGLLKKWPDGGPPKVWTVSGVGGGFSTVIIVGGNIFGTGKVGDKEHIWARDEATGKEKWSTPFADYRKVDRGDGTRSTPTYANGKLYAVSIDGTLACLDATTGKLVWSKSYVKDFGGNVPGWGYSESVLVDDGKVIATPCGRTAAVVALNPATGATSWKTEIKDPGRACGYSSAVKTEIAGVPMYVTLLGKSSTAGVIGVHAKTGKLLWNYERMMNAVANIPSPVVKGDLVFCSTGYGAGAALLKIVPSADGTYRAEEQKFHNGGALQNHHGGMVLVGDHVYLGSQHNAGFPACVEFATGEIKWSEKGPVRGGKGSAAVVAADGMLIFRYEGGLVALIKADPSDFTLVSTFEIPEPSGRPSWPHPAISSGKLYIRDQDKLHCFDIKAK